MNKYVKVCDCPPTGEYSSFVAGKFREVETKDGACVHCGYIAMTMKFNDLNGKRTTVESKSDEIQDQTLELDQNTIGDLDLGGEDVHIDEFSKSFY